MNFPDPDRPSPGQLPAWRRFLERQPLHLALLAVLLLAAAAVIRLPAFRTGELWTWSTPVWFWITVGTAILHQLEVAGWWRSALHTDFLWEVFKSRQTAFKVYAVEFAILILLRPVSITLLAIANRDAEILLPWQLHLQAAAILCLFPIAYLFSSIRRFFSFQRAFGFDHFDPDACREAGLVRDGIFKYVPNAMYTFGLLVLWLPGLWLAAPAAVAAALFHHLYIWVHYFCTEKPDMRFIYRGPDGPR